VFYKWLTAIHPERKPMTGPMVIEKAESLCDEVKVTDNSTFFEGGNKKLPVRTLVIVGSV
jgi:hypothetical protein